MSSTTKTQKAQGHCLCKAVQVTANSVSNSIGACHCKWCLKWCGGPFLTIDCGTDVSFTGEEHIGVFDSSEWAERGFCKQCGSSLFYRLKGNQQYILPVALLDIDPEKMPVFDHQVFVDEQPHYYEFANETTKMTGEEMFAQYSGKE